MSALNWAVYGMVVSLLLGVASLAAETAARWLSRAGRWVWSGALLGSLVLPLWSYLRPESAPVSAPVLAPIMTLPVLIASPAASPSFDWTGLLLAGWVLLSVLVLSAMAWSHLALLRSRRRWRQEEVDGVQAWVSGSTGPAVFGVLRAEIVVPEWLLSADAETRRLMLLHEEEHRAAGDSRLLFFGLLACAALPWNPVVWWQLHRLRAALELDCDARVLARVPEPARYGHLLLDVGRRRTARSLALAAFAEPHALLERRVRALLQWPSPRRPLSALLFAFVALVLFGWACAARDPLASNNGSPLERAAVLAAQDTPPAARKVRLDSIPTFTPMTVRPELKNPEEVGAALKASYPPLLRDAGIGGAAILWFFIDGTGAVTKTLIKESSGYPALDEAAQKVAAAMKFRPAYNRENVTPVWVEIPIRFAVDGGSAPPKIPSAGAPPPPPPPTPEQIAAGERATLKDLEAGPMFRPVTRRPEVRNPDEIVKAIQENTPAQLRDVDRSESAVVWFLIDETGRVHRTMIREPSGNPAVDQAGLRVASVFQFVPAYNREKPVAVWVEIPIRFGKQPTGTQPGGARLEERALLNAAELVTLAQGFHPPPLKKAGIQGKAVIWLFVLKDGTVTKVVVAEPSTHKAFDEAAVRVAVKARFVPTDHDTWVGLPIAFTLK